MAFEIGVGGIGAEDSFSWGSSDDMLGGRIHKLVFLYPGLIHIVAQNRV